LALVKSIGLSFHCFMGSWMRIRKRSCTPKYRALGVAHDLTSWPDPDDTRPYRLRRISRTPRPSFRRSSTRNVTPSA
jgi:hypothetical protein